MFIVQMLIEIISCIISCISQTEKDTFVKQIKKNDNLQIDCRGHPCPTMQNKLLFLCKSSRNNTKLQLEGKI